MLEAQAHHQIKTLLRQEESDWPHHLTLSRLVARSLRRRDTTLVQLPPQQQNAGGSVCWCRCAWHPKRGRWC